MGSLIGHILPGTAMFIMGLWWMVNMFYTYFTSRVNKHRFTSSASFPFRFLCSPVNRWPVEGILKIILTTIATIGEIRFGLNLEEKWFENMGNGQHATMYVFYGMAGIIDILLYFRVSLPVSMDYISMALALFIEYLLFSFHDVGAQGLEVSLHLLLGYVILASVVAMLLEMRYRDNIVIAIVRAFLVMLQGTWFLQIAFILFTPTPAWENSHRNITLTAMIFAWHIAALLLFVLCTGGLIKHCIQRRNKLDGDWLNDTSCDHKTSDFTELKLLSEIESDLDN